MAITHLLAMGLSNYVPMYTLYYSRVFREEAATPPDPLFQIFSLQKFLPVQGRPRMTTMTRGSTFTEKYCTTTTTMPHQGRHAEATKENNMDKKGPPHPIDVQNKWTPSLLLLSLPINKKNGVKRSASSSPKDACGGGAAHNDRCRKLVSP